MKFIVRNHAKVANKYIRFAKWKLRRLNEKFNSIIYSEIFIKKEGKNPELYLATLKLGVPGPDIIISASSTDLNGLWAEISAKTKRQLRKYSDKRNYR